MKKCIKCNKEKEFTEFNKHPRTKDKLSGVCRVCNFKHRKEYKEANSKKIKEQNKLYRLNNKEKIKEYFINNKEKLKEKQREYYKENSKYFKEKQRRYYKENLIKVLDYQKKYNILNQEKIKNYRLNNKEKINNYQNEYCKNKKLINNLFKLRCNISSNISKSFRRNGYSKKSKTYQILGCTYEEFKQHLEKQFTKGMTWENQGKWHLDHIYPVSLAKDEEELIRLNHYTNFQPMWAIDNIKKSNKILWQEEENQKD